MKVPKSLVSVTPYSKAVALFLLLLFPLAGFYLGMQFQYKWDAGLEAMREGQIIEGNVVHIPVINQAATGNTITITNADLGKTSQVHVGDTIVLALTGGNVAWVVTFSDPTILVSTSSSASVTTSPQGSYVAAKKGIVTLSAQGTPICKSKLCPMFLIGFHTTIVVN